MTVTWLLGLPDPVWYCFHMTSKPSAKRSEQQFTIGRKAFARISAVEGVQTTVSMDADFRSFDKKGFSAPQRRQVLSEKYGKAR